MPSTLNRFPTINSDLLVTIGGEKNKKKIVRLKVFDKYATDVVHRGDNHPDIEATGIRR